MSLAAGGTVAVFTKPNHPDAPRLLRELGAWLGARGLRMATEAEAGAAAGLAVILGGDGTMLHVAPRLARARTPVLAVHLGTLGFLTETALADLYSGLDAALAGRAVPQRRALLRARIERPGAPIFDALNEVVVSKGALARIIQADLTIDGVAVGDYRADGILVATPTGSTAYSLSAGGPVVHPGLEALLVTPICPHSLSQRPLVVSDHGEIAITLRPASEPAFLTIDGQQGVALKPGDRIVCTRSPLELTLLTAQPHSFFHSLRSKLHWG